MSNSNTTQGNKDSMPKSEKSGVGGQSGSQHGGQGGQQGGQQQGGQQGGQQPNRGGPEGRANRAAVRKTRSKAKDSTTRVAAAAEARLSQARARRMRLVGRRLPAQLFETPVLRGPGE